MKQVIYFLIFLLTASKVFSQTTYKGRIGEYPVELVTDVYPDGDARAIYTYTNFDEPIVINGRLHKKTLTLTEKTKNNKASATLTFENFKAESGQLEGVWKDLSNGKQLAIHLTKEFEINFGDSTTWKDREILQPVSLPGKYFKLIVSKPDGEFSTRATGLKILEKKTDRLLQQFAFDCQLTGIENLSIGDFNFDGLTDFAVFEQGYAGPNSTSLYFLYNKKTGQFFNSGFEGTSLYFDGKTKRIYEHNECCMGTSHINAEYKIVDNKMVLIKKTCIVYDKKKKDFVTVKCE